MDKKHLAKKIAEESIVLLKNDDHMLPFKDKKVAFFGRTQIGTLYSGNGSGGANVHRFGTILSEAEKAGVVPEANLKQYYQEELSKKGITAEDEFDWSKIDAKTNSGIMYEIFGKYHAPLPEFVVPDKLVKQATSITNQAVIVIGRNSGGEECDRHLNDDYYLTQSEKKLVNQVCENFKNIVLVLNTNGLIDLSWLKNYSNIKSVLFIGIPGEEGASALANILIGKVNPSGKLAMTIAKKYEDYPSSKDFSWDKEHLDEVLDYESYGLPTLKNFAKKPVTVYREGIYVGYRYFDTFNKKVLFPFGFGLSYTSFDIAAQTVKKTKSGIEINVKVTNTGKTAGKEVIQAYLVDDSNNGKLEHPYQELKAFSKTSLLMSNSSQTLKLQVPWGLLSSYDEQTASWIIDSNNYRLAIGNSSRNNIVVAKIIVPEKTTLEKCHNELQIKKCNQSKIKFLSCKNISSHDIQANTAITTISVNARDIILNRNNDLKKSNNHDLSGLSIKELAALCVGYGPGTPFSAVSKTKDPATIFDDNGQPLTSNDHPTGLPGYVSPAIESKGIKSVYYKDGPAGIGQIAWPTEMLIACSFDKELWYEFGNAIGKECEEKQVNVWLAPAVNIQRNPLCGRNFEYFSEDPFLTGTCAVNIAQGVQENHSVLVCPKHFVLNEQETFRRGNARKRIDAVDSIVTERTAREIYLKPFEMLVKEAKITCIMTAFNKINGTFAAGNKDLCTDILRNEWHFNGVVITDWGDMDIVVNGAEAIKAGNDIIMPGGPPVIKQILAGYEEGRIKRDDLEKAVKHLLIMLDQVITES